MQQPLHLGEVPAAGAEVAAQGWHLVLPGHAQARMTGLPAITEVCSGLDLPENVPGGLAAGLLLDVGARAGLQASWAADLVADTAA